MLEAEEHSATAAGNTYQLFPEGETIVRMSSAERTLQAFEVEGWRLDSRLYRGMQSFI